LLCSVRWNQHHDPLTPEKLGRSLVNPSRQIGKRRIAPDNAAPRLAKAVVFDRKVAITLSVMGVSRSVERKRPELSIQLLPEPAWRDAGIDGIVRTPEGNLLRVVPRLESN
jgi:hypothetical protein